MLIKYPMLSAQQVHDHLKEARSDLLGVCPRTMYNFVQKVRQEEGVAFESTPGRQFVMLPAAGPGAHGKGKLVTLPEHQHPGRSEACMTAEERLVGTMPDSFGPAGPSPQERDILLLAVPDGSMAKRGGIKSSHPREEAVAIPFRPRKHEYQILIVREDENIVPEV